MVQKAKVGPEGILASSTGALVVSAAEATKGVKMAEKASMLKIEGFGKGGWVRKE